MLSKMLLHTLRSSGIGSACCNPSVWGDGIRGWLEDGSPPKEVARSLWCLHQPYGHVKPPLGDGMALGHSELFCLHSFGNWKFENLPISIPLCIKMFFRPYIFVIQSKKVYRLSRTLIKIAFNSGENCFFAYFSIFSLVSQGRYLVKSHICGILWRK